VVHFGTCVGTDQGAPGAPGRALNDLFSTSVAVATAMS